jgi:hypothetical protein
MANASNECLVCLTPKKIKINNKTLFYSYSTELYYKKDCECVVYCHIKCMEKWITENPVCLICRGPFGIRWTMTTTIKWAYVHCADIFSTNLSRKILVLILYFNMLYFIYNYFDKSRLWMLSPERDI